MLKLEDKLINLLYQKEKAVLGRGKSDILGELNSFLKNDTEYIDIIKRELGGVNRIVVLLTHKCQLNCKYCRVKKFGQQITLPILYKAIDLLLTSTKKEVQLQFFGGEPLLSFDLVKKGVEYGNLKASRTKKRIKYLLTTNGLALTSDKIEYFKSNEIDIELSFDGDKETQLKNRRNIKGADYYSILLKNAKELSRSGVNYNVISVVAPNNLKNVLPNIKLLTKVGFKKIQLNYNLGVFWSEKKMKDYYKEIENVRKYLSKQKVVFVNDTYERREPVVLNAEITADCDGDLFLETGICLEEDFKTQKKEFYLGNLRNIKDINKILTSRYENFKALVRVYTKKNPAFRKIILSNVKMGWLFKNEQSPRKIKQC